jgi:hypothetical protein
MSQRACENFGPPSPRPTSRKVGEKWGTRPNLAVVSQIGGLALLYLLLLREHGEIVEAMLPNLP